MDLLVAYATPAETRALDTEAPTVPRTAEPSYAHAKPLGSAVAVCGSPAPYSTARPWPPTGDPACPRCVAAVKGFTQGF